MSPGEEIDWLQVVLADLVVLALLLACAAIAWLQVHVHV